MAAGSTYTPIATTTGTGSSGTVTFTSIPTTYTDIILIAQYTPSAGSILNCQVGNGSLDTGSNYSSTILTNTGSLSYRYSNRTSAYVGPQNNSTSTTAPTTQIMHFMNYSNTTTNKTFLNRYNDPSGGELTATVSLWRSTSAINRISLQLSTGNFNTSSTFTLYGIAAA